MKKYTIITINFNNSAELRQTIESVVGQTLKDIEYIVIDSDNDINEAELEAAKKLAELLK